MRLLALGGLVLVLFGSGFLTGCGSSGQRVKNTSLAPPDSTSPPSGYRIRTIYNPP
jgi:hypothetical protein